MFVSITTDQRSCRNALNELGISSLSNPIVSLSEFCYKKGRTIYIEGDPAEYVYQVIKGTVRTYKLLSDGRPRLAHFICQVTFLHSRTVGYADLPRKPLRRALFA
jgi:CRP/FNR family transcriptional regulator, nitrogen fixation regulation protein